MEADLPGAQLVGGVWLPEGETHLVDWMQNSRGARRVDGKLTYQYGKIAATLRHQPEERRGLALDIGAHVGLWSMWLVKHFTLVDAYEPCPAFHPLFRRNVTSKRCRLYRYGLGDDQETVTVVVPRATTGAAHVAGRSALRPKFNASDGLDRYHDCRVVALDSVHRGPIVDFIKIDAEGWEAKILRGAEKTIMRYRPNIVVECKGNDVAYGEEPRAAVNLLESWGMKPLEVISGDWIMGW